MGLARYQAFTTCLDIFFPGHFLLWDQAGTTVSHSCRNWIHFGDWLFFSATSERYKSMLTMRGDCALLLDADRRASDTSMGWKTNSSFVGWSGESEGLSESSRRDTEHNNKCSEVM